MYPTITVSFAQSIDGRIATAGGDSQWISGPDSLHLAQGLRRDNETILVGINTVLRDDPLLTCRIEGSRSPARIVLDSRLRLPVDSKIARTSATYRSVVMTSEPVDSRRARALESLGLEVAVLPRAGEGISVRAAAAWIGERGYRSLFVEGGGAVITAFLRERLVDRMTIVVAPIIVGKGIEAIGDLAIRGLDAALRPSSIGTRRLGEDLVWELSFDRSAPAGKDDGVA